jgi:glucoamylase
MDLLHCTSNFVTSLIPFGNFTLSSLETAPIMYYSVTSFLLSSLMLQAVFGLPPTRVREREAEILKRSVDTFIATESPIALRDLLCNIGSAGACVSGAASGLVIASPDRTNPDCEIISFALLNLRLSNLSRLLYLVAGLGAHVQMHSRYFH